MEIHRIYFFGGRSFSTSAPYPVREGAFARLTAPPRENIRTWTVGP